MRPESQLLAAILNPDRWLQAEAASVRKMYGEENRKLRQVLEKLGKARAAATAAQQGQRNAQMALAAAQEVRALYILLPRTKFCASGTTASMLC